MGRVLMAASLMGWWSWGNTTTIGSRDVRQPLVWSLLIALTLAESRLRCGAGTLRLLLLPTRGLRCSEFRGLFGFPISCFGG
jgi:hypothetical protein